VRKQRPADRSNARRSATAGVSGQAGAAAQGWPAGRPTCGCTKRGGDQGPARGTETDTPSSARMIPDSQTAVRFLAVAALRPRKLARLRSGDDRVQWVRERTGGSGCPPSRVSKMLIDSRRKGWDHREFK
jgi:hypothetical protein